MKAPLTLAILMLGGCGQQAEPRPDQATPAAAAAKPPRAPATAFVYDERNELIDFHYGWSAEAAGVPQLVQQFRREMEMEKTGLLAQAKADKAMRDKEGWPYHRLSRSTDYKTAGQSDRLLVLSVEHASFTGGAHGNYGTSSIFWDRTAGAEVSLGDVFTAVENMDRLLTQRWCDALNKAREEKRDEPVGGGGMFGECPKLSEVAIIPADDNRNGKFERLSLIADPYVAGPYSEGSYEIELAITPELISAVRSAYRDSFETQTQ